MKFKLIYADPPWQYSNMNNTKKFRGTAQSHYTTHNDQEIADWPVGELADDDSLLFLWSTFPKIPEALNTLQKWGFKFITCPFVWSKTYKKSGAPFVGCGFWTRAGAEFVMLGKRGKGLPRKNKSIRQVFQSPVIGHSAKPSIVRDKIVELVGDIQPRIELFSRETNSPGWTQTGLESDGRTIHETVKYYGSL